MRLEGRTGPWAVYIRKAVELRKYGYTQGCPGCEAARYGLPPQTHSAECWQRIEQEMEKYERRQE